MKVACALICTRGMPVFLAQRAPKGFAMSDHHDSPIKTPKQLITVVLLAFAIPLSLIGLLVAYVTGGQHGAEAPQTKKPETVAERIKPVAAVTVRDANAPKVFQTGEQVYKALCVSCHDASSAIKAPKFGDKAAWAPLIKEGFAELVADAIKGNAKGMPPKGGNADLDDIEVARAVAFMANASGASFKEPATPAAPAKAAEAKAADSKAGDAKAAPAAAATPAVVIPPPVVAAAASAAAPAGVKADVGKALYEAACQVCHSGAIPAAPKFADKAAWGPRLGAGVDALTQSVLKGKGAMPPKGMAMTASDADIKAAVVYMVNAAK